MITDKEEMQHLAVNVRIRMDARGYSQPDLARLSGVPQITISRILNEKNEPSICAVSRLAKALRASVDDLLSQPPRRKLRDAS